ncbi:MAG: helix-turn-helix domain-containing protein [Lactobacillus iners]|nr:helix-turn-helix domain-containing protein [Lactobacillus iners]
MQWKLIKLRKERKITQKDLADFIGISESSYINKETGKFQFKQNEMFMISNYFNKKVDDIFLPTEFTVRKGTTEIK